jgi:hypothetical protein
MDRPWARAGSALSASVRVTGFIERGTLHIKTLHRAAVIALIPWGSPSGPEPRAPAASQLRRDPLHLARYYHSLLDSGKFESQSALATSASAGPG